MNTEAVQKSELISQVDKVLSEWTVSRHAEQDATLSSRYGPGWRQRWVESVRMTFAHLAQAVAVQRPELFAAWVQWERGAFASRGVPRSDLETSLRCMADEASNHLPNMLADTVREYVEAAINGSATFSEEGVAGDVDVETDTMVLEYLKAVLSAQPEVAHRILLDAAENGRSVADLYAHVLYPAQVEIGNMWYRDEISAADEHLATAVTQSSMARLRPYFPPVDRQNRRIVVSSVQGETHALGPQMVADFFEMNGWHTFYYGTDLPPDELVRSVAPLAPHIFAFSVTSVLHLRSLGAVIQVIRRHEDLADAKIIVGGAPFNLVKDLWREVGADGSAATADEAVALAESLLRD